MKRVLVTGSGGFIGRHAATELARCGYEVLAPASRELDLLDISQTRDFLAHAKPTHLAHFAWFSGHGKIWDAPENWRWSKASLELFRTFVQHGGRHAFFAGSCAEYDWQSEFLSEQSPAGLPASTYGKSKSLLFADVRDIMMRGSSTVAWGRIFFVYGPGEKESRLAPSILLPLLQNQPAVVRFGNHVRDFLHAEDVARAAAHLLDAEFNGAINIASGNPITLADFATKIAKAVNRESLLKIEYGHPTPENPLILKADTHRLNDAGFIPKYSLDEGIQSLLPNPRAK